MTPLALRALHERLDATFLEVRGTEWVDHYGDPAAEYTALRETAAVADLSARSRLRLLGADRQKFLNGQVTNNVKDLKPGEGCYAALVSAKARIQSDLNIHVLADAVLLDFEPGYSAAVAERLEKYIIADDVQVEDAGPLLGLLSVQGPKAGAAVEQLDPALAAVSKPMSHARASGGDFGGLCAMNVPRTGAAGFDLFVPAPALESVAERLLAATRALGGRPCGWQALEAARIEAGIPRFGADMDETNLAPEAGIERRAISYTKGCYIGQEVISRIRTYGQVARTLRGLRLSDSLRAPPRKGDKLLHENKEIGYVTSALVSPLFPTKIALGYVRREHHQPGTGLVLRTAEGDSPARIIDLPMLPTA